MRGRVRASGAERNAFYLPLQYGGAGTERLPTEALRLAKHFKIGDVLQDGAGFVSTVGEFFEGRAAFYDSAALQSAKEEVLCESAKALPALCDRLRILAQSDRP